MSQQDIIRAWKDRNYRESLSQEQRSQLPDNPAGIIELSGEALETISGGRGGGTGQGTGGNCTKCISEGCGHGTGAGTGGNCTKCNPCGGILA